MIRHLHATILLALLCAQLSLPVAVSASAADQRSGPTVVALSLENPSIVADKEILALFKPGVGELYSKGAVNRSLSVLSHVSGIETIQVFAREEAAGVKLRLVVKPQPLIRSIYIEGLDKLEKSDITVSMYTRVDEPVYQPFLEQDVEYILERLGEIGYRDARVETEVKQSKKVNWVNVTFTVVEGLPTRIAALGDMGQSAVIGEKRVLSELGLKVGSIASQPRLREGVRELEQYCWQKGYPEARVLGERFVHAAKGDDEKTQPQPEALLQLPLSLGERTSFEITGAPEWHRGALRDLLKSRYGEEIDEDWLSHAVRDMRDALVEEGFMNATVNYRADVDAEGRRFIFEVTPEKRVHLDAVVFERIEALDEDDVTDVMESLQTGFFGATPLFKREVLDADLGRIRQYYISEGFLRAKVWVKELVVMPDGATTAIMGLEEGPRFYYGKIDIFIDTDAIGAATAASVAAISFGQPASPAALEKARVNLLAEMSKRGYINAAVKVMATPAGEGQRVDVDIKMTSGPQKRFGTIVVSGNTRTETKVVLRELDFKSGEPWNQAKILLSRRELFRLGFFQEVKIEPLGRVWPDRTQDIIVRVREQNAGYMDYGFGYGTEERFKAFFEIGHSNISGTGRSLSLRLTTGSSGNSYALNFREPWILDYPVDLRVSLLNQREEREAYTLDSTALQVALDREFSNSIRGSLIYTLEDNDLTGVDPGAVLTDEDVEPYRVSAIGPLMIYDSRDDPFNPRWGFYHNVRAEWARTDIGSDLEFGRYTGFASTYLSVEKLTLALLARGGLIEYYGITNELPVNKRFFLGGRTTVRGFDRDTIGPKAADGSVIGGDLMVNLKAELRFPIKGDIGGALFWDAGQAWQKSSDDFSWKGLRHGAGFGLRYNTPVGPLALDLGFKMDKEDGEKGSQWHFTIGNAF